ncbi:MAG: cupin [Cyanobacteria bacterium SBLK]|nr:cupin [Cyanobacteria bacterium SBLK]
MDGRNWLVTDQGVCQELNAVEDEKILTAPYRLYQFLADLDRILDRFDDNAERLKRLCPRVRRLMDDSPWLQLQYTFPDPQKGWSVSMLYDEPGYPITVQMVAWEAGRVSTIHNHAAWGLVMLLDGEEKNTFWQRSPESEFPDRIEKASEQIFSSGDIICFLPDAIHSVEAMGDSPTISFNLYGITTYDRRFVFDPQARTAKTF